MWKKIKPYVISIIIALAVGGLSALLTKGNMDIYSRINVPSFAPPTILFPVVWSILYTIMGISSANVYVNRDKNPKYARDGLVFYAFNLIVNFFWSLIFFNLNAFLFSFIWLLLLIVIVIIMIYDFAKVTKWAGYIQLPYLAWLIFASILNYSIYIIN